MAHKKWCGKNCSECKTSCGVDESMPCSPDCEGIVPETGEPGGKACDGCEVIKKKKVYDQVVKTLMENDHNGSWDEIFDEAEKDLEYAINLLQSALKRIIEEDGCEGEELEFYDFQLARVERIAEC